MFENLNKLIKNKLQETLKYPVVHVSDDYEMQSDFFEVFKDNLTLARDNIDPSIGYVLTAVDVTPAQLGLEDENMSYEENNTHRRFFLPMTTEQADVIISIQAMINLEGFMMMFSDFVTRDIAQTPNLDHNIAVIEFDEKSGDITDVMVVPLVMLPENPNLVEEAKKLIKSGHGSSIAARSKIRGEIQRLHTQLYDGEDTYITGEEKVIEENENIEEDEENQGPYSANALHKMYEEVGDEEVDDEAVDFIFAMMDKMTQDQKDKITEMLSSNWASVMGPRVGTLLMSINTIAEDIPVSTKNYLNRINTIFGDSVTEETKNHMVVQFHSAIIQKIV